jgi:transcriptional regulator with XRE-family HTH domain
MSSYNQILDTASPICGTRWSVGREELEDQAARLKAVRESMGMTQLQFLARLNGAAERLGTRPYVQSLLSRLENGLQVPSFDDLTVYATLDPEHRGRLWLGWGLTEDETLKIPESRRSMRVAERLGPSVIQEPDPKIFDEPPLPRPKPAAKKRRGA